MWGKSSIRCDIWVAVRSDFSETSCYCCELFGSFTGISYFPHKTHNEVHPGKRLLCLNDFPPEKWQTQTKQDTVIPSHLCMCFHLVITEILWELVLTATHHMIWGMFFFFFFKKKMCGVNLWGTIFKQNRWLHSCFKIISLDPSPLQMDSHNCTHSGFVFFFLTSEAQCHVKLCFRV